MSTLKSQSYSDPKKILKIAFHLDQFSFRGSEIAVYDYAHYNETILHNISIIVIKNNYKYQISYTGEFKSRPEIEAKFKDRFLVYEYSDAADLSKYLRMQKVSLIHFLKSGEKEELPLIDNSIPAVIHCIFTLDKTLSESGLQGNNKTTHLQVPISTAVEEKFTEDETIPHIVHLPTDLRTNLRNRLSIPDDAIVFGRHGGHESFDLPFVHRTIWKVAKENPKIYFLFLATNNFCIPKEEHYLRNIIFLPVNCDNDYKQAFINTCDAMIHGRKIGESFGYAVAEFSVSNKPVLTYKCDKSEKDYREHLFHHQILGDKGFYYRDEKELEKLLLSPIPEGEFDSYSKRFSPERIMGLFKKNIIDRLIKPI